MLATYEATIYPLPSQSAWSIPNAIKDIVVLPAKGRIYAQRPKKTRFKNPWETKSENKCERCEQYGHNRQTCQNSPKLQ